MARWLLAEAARRGPILAGLDFCFALPYCDKGAYLPEADAAPRTVFDLWRRVEDECAADGDFYAGAIHHRRTAPLAAYFNCAKAKGRRFVVRFRETERHTQQQDKTRPLSAFNCVGKSVGCGSLSGMRFLHPTRGRDKGAVRVWPFEPVDGASLVLVEIFPQVFLKRALGRTAKVTSFGDGNAAIAAFGGRPLTASPRPDTADAWDALVSAAALRRLSAAREAWKPASMTGCARTREGWIFGVR